MVLKNSCSLFFPFFTAWLTKLCNGSAIWMAFQIVLKCGVNFYLYRPPPDDSQLVDVVSRWLAWCERNTKRIKSPLAKKFYPLCAHCHPRLFPVLRGLYPSFLVQNPIHFFFEKS